ncbi:hypothetical protein [Polyangium sp. 6x1]|uniref:hypothetical protein n=1 Tax=Polyangium sp. 6x1 TaxID=3042689 RepID=UPI002483077F|nr:hypothetical protein [Polyangium sp. 6x1]MDI1444868.1 hypothetical protein [Polyangium sp. 6x1]
MTSKVQRNRLQPYHVFVAELARLNEVYWTSKYALERIPATLKAIAATASDAEDPAVGDLWRSSNPRMHKQLTISLSEFRRRATATTEFIRAISVVGICSAFENAIANYFALACLYNPKSVLSGWNHASVPKILRSKDAYTRLQRRATERAAEVLRAGYGTRIFALIDAFGADRADLEIPAALETYHGYRHLLAHNQGVEEDGPWLPPDDLVAARIVVDEEAWRQMLADFSALMGRLDRIMQTVIPDRAIHLAVHWVMEHLASEWITLGTLRNRVNVRWHLLESVKAIEETAVALGYRVSAENNQRRRRVMQR